jgi:hypothetical protein
MAESRLWGLSISTEWQREKYTQHSVRGTSDIESTWRGLCVPEDNDLHDSDDLESCKQLRMSPAIRSRGKNVPSNTVINSTNDLNHQPRSETEESANSLIQINGATQLNNSSNAADPHTCHLS